MEKDLEIKRRKLRIWIKTSRAGSKDELIINVDDEDDLSERDILDMIFDNGLAEWGYEYISQTNRK